ncbi:MAG: hypothetical protein WCE90_00470 [Candidatus Zixiibacteriota bacterium]
MKKLLLTILVGCCLVCFATTQPQAGLNFGVKSLTLHNSIIPLDQSMGSYFGVDVGQNLVILGGLDYGRLGVKPEVSIGNVTINENMSVSYLQPHVGAKLYLKPRQQGKVSPYVLGEVLKSFGSVSVADTVLGVVTKDIKKAVKDLLSPFGVVGAFGSEYYFSDGFGIGGEVGLQLIFISTKLDTEPTTKISIDRYLIYGGFTFNFKL